MSSLPLMADVMFNPERAEHDLFETQASANAEKDGDNSSESSSEEEEESKPPTTVIKIAIHNRQTEQEELFTVLLDSGSSSCLATMTALKRAGIKIKASDKHHRFKTAAGKFTSTQRAKIRTHHMAELG